MRFVHQKGETVPYLLTPCQHVVPQSQAIEFGRPSRRLAAIGLDSGWVGDFLVDLKAVCKVNFDMCRN